VSVGSSLSVGQYHDGHGMITVTGYGSQFTVGTFSDIGQGLDDSSNPTTGLGYGALQVLQGAQATFNGMVGVGTYLQSAGDLQVDGTDGAGHASTLTVIDNSLNIGRGYVDVSTTTGTGHGSLTVSNGGQVIVSHVANPDGGQVLVGEAASGIGQVTVTGPGSTLAAGGPMIIGQFGSGMLHIEDGGAVTSTDGYVGRFDGSSAAATITGPSSQWTVVGDVHVAGDPNAGAMTIASGGRPTLFVNNAGQLNVQESAPGVGGNLKIWALGALDLTDGQVVATAIDVQGALQGTGTVSGAVTNEGLVSPGHSPGILTVNGDYTQTAAGILRIEIGGPTAGTGFDQINITGDAALAGELDIVFFNNFAANPLGLPIAFLTASGPGGVTGVFDPSQVHFINGTGTIQYTAGSVELTGAAVPEPASLLLLSVSSMALLRRRRPRHSA
jgi:T5SS/PEP-CTERM-associated repeat protein